MGVSALRGFSNDFAAGFEGHVMSRPREIRIVSFDGAEHARVAVPRLTLWHRLRALVWRLFR